MDRRFPKTASITLVGLFVVSGLLATAIVHSAERTVLGEYITAEW